MRFFQGNVGMVTKRGSSAVVDGCVQPEAIRPGWEIRARRLRTPTVTNADEPAGTVADAPGRAHAPGSRQRPCPGVVGVTHE
jgi:hypothetical protein